MRNVVTTHDLNNFRAIALMCDSDRTDEMRAEFLRIAHTCIQHYLDRIHELEADLEIVEAAQRSSQRKLGDVRHAWETLNNLLGDCT